jgi:hypothetical protein
MPDVALRGMSAAMHKALKEAAERNHRSLNGEILARLERSVMGERVDLGALLARIDERRSRLALELDEETLREFREEGRP